MIGLEEARLMMRSVLSESRRIERGASRAVRPPRAEGRASKWKSLRGWAERLMETLALPLQGSAPERSPELDARSRLADATLAKLQAAQALLDNEWDKAIRELADIHAADRALSRGSATEPHGEEARPSPTARECRLQNPSGSGPPPGSVGERPAPEGRWEAADRALPRGMLEEAQERASLLDLLWSELLREEASALRERAFLAETWKRLMEDVLPRVDDSSQPWAALSSRLRRMDARWGDAVNNQHYSLSRLRRTQPTERYREEVPPPGSVGERPTEPYGEEVCPNPTARECRPQNPLGGGPPPSVVGKRPTEPYGEEIPVALPPLDIGGWLEALILDKAKVDRLEEEIRSVRLQMERAPQERLPVLREVERELLRSKSGLLEEGLERAQGRLASMRLETEELRSGLRSALERCGEADAAAEILRREKREQADKLARTREREEALLKRLESSGKKLEAALAGARSAGLALAELRRFQRETLLKLEQAQASLGAAGEKAEDLERRLARKDAERDRLSESAKAEIRDLERKLSLLETERGRLSERLEEAARLDEGRSRETARKDSETENLRRKHREAILASEDARRERKRLLASLGRALEERDALQAGLQARSTESREREEELKAMLALGEKALRTAHALPAMEPTAEPVPEPAWSGALALLRQPLSAAYAQLKRLTGVPLPEGPRAAVRMAAGALSQAQDIVKVLGEYLEGSTAPPSPGRLDASLDAALASWEPAFRRARISVVRKFETGTAGARFQTEGLRVALYQLLRNAYEAMPSGGCLTARLWRDEASGQACLSLSDSGRGFSKEALAGLFEPMGNARPGHLGLGLALVRRIQRRLGGEAEAGNVPPGGACVTLRFPPEPPPPLGDVPSQALPPKP